MRSNWFERIFLAHTIRSGVYVCVCERQRLCQRVLYIFGHMFDVLLKLMASIPFRSVTGCSMRLWMPFLWFAFYFPAFRFRSSSIWKKMPMILCIFFSSVCAFVCLALCFVCSHKMFYAKSECVCVCAPFFSTHANCHFKNQDICRFVEYFIARNHARSDLVSSFKLMNGQPIHARPF